MLKFVRPDYQYRKEYTEMMDEWIADGSRIAPWSLIEQYHTDEDFENMIRQVNDAEFGKNIGMYAPCKTYWVKNVDSTEIIGAVNIRYYLTQLGYETWGHIGYGVRPTQRRKGYATQILNMALDECRSLHMEKVLLGCLEDNLPSAKTIEKCKGVLENVVVHDNNGTIEKIKRYWIVL